jgi:ABC-type multidrug transport system ATPase subunit
MALTNVMEARGLIVRAGQKGRSMRVPDFVLAAGQLILVEGKNGCGKTTMLNALSGIATILQGSLYVGGCRCFGRRCLPFLDRPIVGLGRSFQQCMIFEHLSLGEHLALAGEVRSLSWQGLRSYEHELLTTVGVANNQLEESAGKLSFGQRKVVGVLMAMRRATDCLLLDEPFAGLFPELAYKLGLIIDRLRIGGMGIIVACHLLDYLPVLNASVRFNIEANSKC